MAVFLLLITGQVLYQQRQSCEQCYYFKITKKTKREELFFPFSLFTLLNKKLKRRLLRQDMLFY